MRCHIPLADPVFFFTPASLSGAGTQHYIYFWQIQCSSSHQPPCLVQARNTICLPVRQHPAEPARFVTLDVLHRFEFDADHMMSGVVARGAASGKEEEEPEVFLKGSPHAVVQLVAHNRLPDNWAPVSIYMPCMLCTLCMLWSLCQRTLSS